MSCNISPQDLTLGRLERYLPQLLRLNGKDEVTVKRVQQHLTVSEKLSRPLIYSVFVELCGEFKNLSSNIIFTKITGDQEFTQQ